MSEIDKSLINARISVLVEIDDRRIAALKVTPINISARALFSK
ncbi:MAG: hypothetical protein P9L97_08905 [Candidatus Tenebribacter davisii]|nr:hypothetical protein [Candidatus Tenebribacter davisii]